MTVQAARFSHIVIAIALMVAAAAIPGGARAQDGHYVTYWTSEQVLAVKRDSSNTIPPIRSQDYPATFPDHYGCEDWTLATRDNRTAEIDGQPIIMSLAAPRDVAPGERHFSARLRQEANGLTTRFIASQRTLKEARVARGRQLLTA